MAVLKRILSFFVSILLLVAKLLCLAVRLVLSLFLLVVQMVLVIFHAGSSFKKGNYRICIGSGDRPHPVSYIKTEYRIHDRVFMYGCGCG